MKILINQHNIFSLTKFFSKMKKIQSLVLFFFLLLSGQMNAQWQKVHQPQIPVAYPTSPDFASGDNFFIVDSDSKVHQTSDYGQSFQSLDEGWPAGYLNVFYAYPDYDLAALWNDDHLYRRLTGSSTWTPLTSPMTGFSIFWVHRQGNKILVYALNLATFEGYLLRSDDEGTTWAVADFPLGGIGADPVSNDSLLSLGTFYTTDAGANWQAAQTGVDVCRMQSVLTHSGQYVLGTDTCQHRRWEELGTDERFAYYVLGADCIIGEPPFRKSRQF
jgi:hypothetical protein